LTPASADFVLLNACDVEEVVKIATANEVMPQKSTDFFPKLLSGITMYRRLAPPKMQKGAKARLQKKQSQKLFDNKPNFQAEA